MMWILSADIGGTKLALAIFKEDEPSKPVRQLVKPSPQEAEALLQAVIDGFGELLAGETGAITKVAIGLPGILDVEQGIVIHQQNLPWRNYPLVAKLQEVYAEARITIGTDMMMAAMGEYKVRGYERETLIYITVSTGIASSAVHEGRVVRGAGIQGEIGFSYTTSGHYLEDECAGPGLERRLQQATGEQRSLAELLAYYYEGDARVMPVMEAWQKELALKIHALMLLIDPHTVVLGGGVMNHHPQLVGEIAARVDAYFDLPFFQHKRGRVEASITKGNAGLVGAAMI